MIAGKIGEYVAALGKDVSCSPDVGKREFCGVSIDSRTIQRRNLFFCVSGEVHDGHDYIDEAVAKGAAAVIANHERLIDSVSLAGTPLITVPDPLWSMGELAKEHLSRLALRKIAVTGTNGKTTCKELIRCVLGGSLNVCSTRGNFNNLYGVPLSIFEFDRSCEAAVLEFGMSTPGEITRLVEIVDPDVRVILNIGPAHLETMKTLAAIAEAKFEILANPKSGDWAVAYLDDPEISARLARYSMQIKTFGNSSLCQVRPESVYANGSGHTRFRYQGEDIRVPLLGRHHLANCLAALAVGEIFTIPPGLAKRGIESFRASGNRMESQIVQGVTIINDAYNANPVSAKAVLEAIAEIPVTGRRIAVLGDMRELGDEAERYHYRLGGSLAVSKCDQAVLTGEFAEVVRAAAVEAGLPDSDAIIISGYAEIAAYLADLVKDGDLVLFKASRALQLERAVAALVQLIRGRS